MANSPTRSTAARQRTAEPGGSEPDSRKRISAAARTHDLVGLQRLAGNHAVQRLIDGFYAGGKTKVPKSRISLTKAFKEKHVAADATGARSITGTRIDSGKPQAMVNGTLANTVAKEEDWLTAIDSSTAVIPDQDDWTGGLPVAVTGWNAKRTGQRSITVTDMAAEARTVGGFMKKAGGAVQVDHVAGI